MQRDDSKEVIILADFCLKWSLFYDLSGWVVTVGNKSRSHLRSSQPKAPFPREMTSGYACRNSILMTRNYPYLDSASDWIGHFKFKTWCNNTSIFISFAIERILSGRWPFLKSCVTLLNTNVLTKLNQN